MLPCIHFIVTIYTEELSPRLTVGGFAENNRKATWCSPVSYKQGIIQALWSQGAPADCPHAMDATVDSGAMLRVACWNI